MRTTITLNDAVFKGLKMRAAQTGESISSLVEEAVKYQLLEDIEDLDFVDKRSKEPSLNFKDLVKQFKAEGLL